VSVSRAANGEVAQRFYRVSVPYCRCDASTNDSLYVFSAAACLLTRENQTGKSLLRPETLPELSGIIFP